MTKSEFQALPITFKDGFNSIVKTEYKFKDGTTIPVGQHVMVYFDEKNSYNMYIDVINQDRVYKVSIRRGYLHLSGFIKEPSANLMEKWESERGMCKTVLGNVTEPDGTDEHGAPSWMLVIGFI